jgi:hypothetical protein
VRTYADMHVLDAVNMRQAHVCHAGRCVPRLQARLSLTHYLHITSLSIQVPRLKSNPGLSEYQASTLPITVAAQSKA